MSRTVDLPTPRGETLTLPFPEGDAGTKREAQWAVWSAAGDMEREAWRSMPRPLFEAYRDLLRAAYADALDGFAPWPMTEAAA